MSNDDHATVTMTYQTLKQTDLLSPINNVRSAIMWSNMFANKCARLVLSIVFHVFNGGAARTNAFADESEGFEPISALAVPNWIALYREKVLAFFVVLHQPGI